MSLDDRRGAFTKEAPKIFSQGLYEDSSTIKQDLGTKRCLADGREFVYVQAGGTALVVGNVIQQAVAVSGHHELVVPTAVAVGQNTVGVTLTTTASTLNQYADGYMHINESAVLGPMYKIRSHAAQTSTTGLLTCVLYDKVRVAITTSNEITLLINPYKGVIQAPVDTLTGAIVGVAHYIITASYYGWIQTKGIASVLTIGTAIIGNKVVSPTGTAAGACGPAGDDIAITIGSVVEAGVTTEQSFAILDI